MSRRDGSMQRASPISLNCEASGVKLSVASLQLAYIIAGLLLEREIEMLVMVQR